MIQRMEQLQELIQGRVTKIAIAGADDEPVLEAVKIAVDKGLIEPLLVGRAEIIKQICTRIGLRSYQLYDCSTPEQAVEQAVRLTRSGQAEVLMKGLVNTSVYMKGVLNKTYGLRTDRLLSLLAVYELPEYHKLIYTTDSGVNVLPNLEQKKQILWNALTAIRKMGISQPKVAIMAANETVNPKIPATVEARELAEMGQRGEFGDCIIEGPLSFDIAFSKEAAQHKAFASQVSGDLDLILFPNIEAGNLVSKSWILFNQAKWAGIVLGATNPVILGSRSDTAEIKLNAIVMGCLAAQSL